MSLDGLSPEDRAFNRVLSQVNAGRAYIVLTRPEYNNLRMHKQSLCHLDMSDPERPTFFDRPIRIMDTGNRSSTG